MKRVLPAVLALLLLVPASGLATGQRRLAVTVEGGRRLEVFRAIPLYRGLSHEIEVSGRGVDAATRVEAGAGLEVVPESLRRSAGSVRAVVRVDRGALLGPAELRLRFARETSGPEVLPAVVLRNGRVTSVEPRRVLLGQKVVLAFSGTEIGNAGVLARNAFTGAVVLPGGSETQCRVELTFTRPGLFEVPLYDRAGIPRPAPAGDAGGGFQVAPEARIEVVSS